jgi:hypothetical protein
MREMSNFAIHLLEERGNRKLATMSDNARDLSRQTHRLGDWLGISFPPNHNSELNFRMSQNLASGALGLGSLRSIPESVPAPCQSSRFQCFRTIPVRV